MTVTLTTEEARMSCARGCCATQREHYKSIVFGVTPPESDRFKGGYTKKFDSDMDAYAQLRRDGLQPDRVDDSTQVLQALNSGQKVEFEADFNPHEIEVDA